MLQQVEDQQQHGRLFKIKSNEPLLLDSPVVWLLQSGAITLFTVVVNNGIPEGARHYLSSVEADSALFGTALSPQPGKQLCFLAVAMEETYLRKVSLDQLGESIVRGDTEAIAQLENWIHRLGAAIRTSTPAVSLPAVDNRAYLSLTCGQTFQATPGTVAWVKIQRGRAKWLGLTAFTLDSTSEVFPLGTGMWLEAADDIVELAMTTTADADWDLLSAGFAQLHTSCRSYFQFEQQQEAQAAFSRFQERARLNRQVTQTALDELASVLQPQEAAATLLPEGTPLLVAAGAVGRVLGVPIQPPRRSEEIDRVKDPLEAIARASQIRTRRVLLAGNWWQQNNGPLLAYLQQERPVALLPVSVGRYELFDPVERTRKQVDARVAAGVSPEAYMFYRPLTDKVKHATGLFLFSIRGYERDLLLMIVAGVAVTLLGMVTPQATAILIDSAIPDSDRGLLWQIGLALFAVAFGQAAFELARGVVSLRVENAADSALQPAVWDRLLSLKPAFFRQYSSGDIQSRVLSVGQIRRQLSGTTLRTIFSGVFAVLNLGLMFTYSASLTLVATVLAVVAMFATIVTSLLALRKVRPLQQIDGLLLGLTVQLINGVSKLRVAAAEERAFAHWGKTYSREKRLKAASQRIDDSLAVFNETLPTISSVLLFWFAIVFMQQSPVGGQGGLTAGTFLAFNAAFGIFIQGATSLSNTLANVLNIVPLWERAQSIVKAVPEATADQADPGRLTGRLRLEHVTFRYREDGPLTLDDVSIHAEPGEFVAVVGPSGSGKSTVFRLLLGFETPASGTVYYDGQDLSGLDIRAVRRQLGVVMQAGKLSTGSVFELITGGALVTMDEAWEAAHNAGFADDVKQMPMQMHTVVSEGGSNLSGGQRQRLLIARALVMKPKIILMDEATSALDNNTQAIVTASLDRMNATRIVIAHRLSTIRNADRIYVVEAGRVVQAGNFDQLVAQEGLFARLVARQIE